LFAIIFLELIKEKFMETNDKDSCENCAGCSKCCGHHKLPAWLLMTLGVLVSLFLLALVVDKGSALVKSFKGQKPDNTISMSAEGKVTATPDMATINIGVMTVKTNAKDAQDENSKKSNKVIDFVMSLGIPKEDVTTSQFNVYPQYNYQSGRNEITGYQATQTIVVKVKGVDKSSESVGKLIDGATDNGANEIQGVSLSFDNPDNLKQEARKIAISKAKEKAIELAQESGLKLGKVVSISENGGSTPYPMYSEAYGMGGGAMDSKTVTPSVPVGSQDVTATMTVVFEVK
jgi:uncharacterized protein